METERRYYEAYEDRYRQVHCENLRWASDQPTPIVEQIVHKFGISQETCILELGCGEGRDAMALLKKHYRVLATDISSAAVEYCRRVDSEHGDCYQTLDCVRGQLDEKFSFIYAVAVLHMLVEDFDRDGFYGFIRDHLEDNSVALICTMGDGEVQVCSDPACAFTLQERQHQETGKILKLAGTSCRMVSFPVFREELEKNGLMIVQEGITSAEPDFDKLMYAVVKRK